MKDVSDSGATSSVGRREYVTPPPPLASVSFDLPSDEDDIRKRRRVPRERVDALAGARAPSSVEADVREAPPCSAQRVDEPPAARAFVGRDDIKKAPPCCSGKAASTPRARRSSSRCSYSSSARCRRSRSNANRVERRRIAPQPRRARVHGRALFAPAAGAGPRGGSVQVCRRAERDHLRAARRRSGRGPPRARSSRRGFTDRDSLALPLENTPTRTRPRGRGRDAVQCDVGLTSDGVLVLCHDANFRRLAPAARAWTSRSSTSRCATSSACGSRRAGRRRRHVVLGAARELAPAARRRAVPARRRAEGRGRRVPARRRRRRAVAAASPRRSRRGRARGARRRRHVVRRAALPRVQARSLATSAAPGRAAAPRVLLLTRLPEPGNWLRPRRPRRAGAARRGPEAAARGSRRGCAATAPTESRSMELTSVRAGDGARRRAARARDRGVRRRARRVDARVRAGRRAEHRARSRRRGRVVREQRLPGDVPPSLSATRSVGANMSRAWSATPRGSRSRDGGARRAQRGSTPAGRGTFDVTHCEYRLQ